VGHPTNGSVSLGDDGLVTFTPKHNFQGTASFTYVISDGFARSDPATVTIDFEPSFQWHNSKMAADVDGDHVVAPKDLTVLISVLNAAGAQSLVALGPGVKPPDYLDVDADNVVSPRDLLYIISYLNAHGATSQSTVASTDTDASDAPAASNDDALMALLSGDATGAKIKLI
jgi:hypothetical protein